MLSRELFSRRYNVQSGTLGTNYLEDLRRTVWGLTTLSTH